LESPEKSVAKANSNVQNNMDFNNTFGESNEGSVGKKSRISTDLDVENRTPESSGSRRQQEKKRKEAEKYAEKEARGTKLYRIIKKNAREFGVNENEEIINPHSGNAILESNVRQSIRRLVNPSTKNAPSPPGTKLLRASLMKNPETRVLVEYIQQSGRGAKRSVSSIAFKPSKWLGKRILMAKKQRK
jgi:hypothetical protein